MATKRDDGLAVTDPKVRQRYSEAGEAGDALLAIVDGVRGGWTAFDVLAWIRERLVFPGWMRKRDSRALVLELQEPGAGTITVPLLGQLDRAASAKVHAIARAAVAKAISELRVVRDGSLDAFLRAAEDAGHVKHVPMKDGGETWGAVLREGEPLSTWILALAAADGLSGVRDWARLGVCDACERVWFGGNDRTRCPDHRGRSGA